MTGRAGGGLQPDTRPAGGPAAVGRGGRDLTAHQWCPAPRGRSPGARGRTLGPAPEQSPASTGQAEPVGFGFPLADAGFSGTACSFSLDGGLALRSYSALLPFADGASPLAPKVAIYLSRSRGWRRLLRNYGFPVRVILRKVCRSAAVMARRALSATLASLIQ